LETLLADVDKTFIHVHRVQALILLPTQTYSSNDSIRGLFKSFRTGPLEREVQMVQLSATRCSYIAIL